MAISVDPIDTTLWIHIFIQMAAWGVIFPVGMVLGIVKNRWHVPVQVLGTALAILGYALGHMHGGREFRHDNVHSKFASPISFMLFAQVLIGIYLKLHIERGVFGKIRRVVKLAHGIIGKALPVFAWTQMIFGGITALGFCQGDHLWLKRTGRSQEFFDSAVITAWGVVNTFTEHRWGSEWVENDWQHTTMGVIWWCAGLVGIWLSRDRDGRPKRNVIPGFIILITGWAFGGHPQHVHVSAEVHKVYGYTLMAAGATRIIEVSFVLRDRPTPEDARETNSFQYIPVFLLFASGFMFMGATEEQMALVADSGMDHIAYILILFSLASLLFLFTLMLIHLYDVNANRDSLHKSADTGRLGPRLDGHVPIRDANEFELEGLMSDDEEVNPAKLAQDDDESLNSTLGKNSDGHAR
ncbi:hypothetical protein NPX13_g1556 [Xylaria arbuscula]|uniref:Cytochrome b561 domain-containing protein n=1 Tax=Xylaria arbuscula TaxID=114810 RepID=A0A9W8TR76_9PEZI|nr:hypothetical protein NPX13_g1556 [Xylaria arbuscula]